MFLRIPISVCGADQSGKAFEEETRTVEIAKDGARVGLLSVPGIGSELHVTNFTNQRSAVFRVAGRCGESYDGVGEWRLKLEKPATDFWGIAFEESPAAEAAGRIAALLACELCGQREVVSITPAEHESLRAKWSLARLCRGCGVVTGWRAGRRGEGQPARAGASGAAAAHTQRQKSAKAGVAHPAASGAAAARPGMRSGTESRGARRLRLKVPILLKTVRGESEKTATADLSKTGLSCATNLQLEAGDTIEIVIGCGVADSAPSQTAQVRWRKLQGESELARVGVQFITAVEAPTPGGAPLPSDPGDPCDRKRARGS